MFQKVLNKLKKNSKNMRDLPEPPTYINTLSTPADNQNNNHNLKNYNDNFDLKKNKNYNNKKINNNKIINKNNINMENNKNLKSPFPQSYEDYRESMKKTKNQKVDNFENMLLNDEQQYDIIDTKNLNEIYKNTINDKINKTETNHSYLEIISNDKNVSKNFESRKNNKKNINFKTVNFAPQNFKTVNNKINDNNNNFINNKKKKRSDETLVNKIFMKKDMKNNVDNNNINNNINDDSRFEKNPNINIIKNNMKINKNKPQFQNNHTFSKIQANKIEEASRLRKTLTANGKSQFFQTNRESVFPVFTPRDVKPTQSLTSKPFLSFSQNSLVAPFSPDFESDPPNNKKDIKLRKKDENNRKLEDTKTSAYLDMTKNSGYLSTFSTTDNQLDKEEENNEKNFLKNKKPNKPFNENKKPLFLKSKKPIIPTKPKPTIAIKPSNKSKSLQDLSITSQEYKNIEELLEPSSTPFYSNNKNENEKKKQKKTWKCEECNKESTEDKTKCNFCLSRIFCSNCRRQTSETKAKFCPSCGNKL